MGQKGYSWHWLLSKAGWRKSAPSISFRLLLVLGTGGTIALGALGGVTIWRFQQNVLEQTNAMRGLSEQQLLERLTAEANLALARIDTVRSDSAIRLRHLTRSSDVIRGLASRNDATLRELLDMHGRTVGFDRLIAFDLDRKVIGIDSSSEILALNSTLKSTRLPKLVDMILRDDNSRTNTFGYMELHELSPDLVATLGFARDSKAAFVGAEPVFDDFGDLIGALVGVRSLAIQEPTLTRFTELAGVSVVFLLGSYVVTWAGEPNIVFAPNSETGLVRSTEGRHVGRCLPPAVSMILCTFTSASVLASTQQQMFQIGSKQTRSLLLWFLSLATIILMSFVTALVIAVRRTTRGLHDLSLAAKAVATGNLDIRIRPSGVGEAYELSLAFIRMVRRLRSSVRRIEQLAFRDSVTQLLNRESLRIEGTSMLGRNESGIFLFIDLDGFKSINDTFGHHTGDALLSDIAHRLVEHWKGVSLPRGCSTPSIARLGGDEFAVILPCTDPQLHVDEIARDLLSKLESTFFVGGSQVKIGASIGVTCFPQDGLTYEELLVNADLAMYAAKQRGKNQFSFYTSELGRRLKLRMGLERDLKSALHNGEFCVYYQPKVCCITQRIRGVEALVRWCHPQMGTLGPAMFLDLAEEMGLVADIDQFVIGRALAEIGLLINSGVDLVLALNVTATEISNPHFISSISGTLSDTQFPPSKLELEITESVAVRDPKTVLSLIATLRQRGVRLAIDDFGAGYSNLATLASLPFDTLKLDRSLIDGVAREAQKRSLLRIALALAAEFGFDSVAEGVEDPEDFAVLVREGVTMAQGYLFSPPVPLAELSSIVAANRIRPKWSGVRGTLIAAAGTSTAGRAIALSSS